jgi:hypothetical protein
MQKEYFPIGKGKSLVVDYQTNTVQVFAGVLPSTYRFNRAITIQDIINIKKEYEKVRIKKTDP